MRLSRNLLLSAVAGAMAAAFGSESGYAQSITSITTFKNAAYSQTGPSTLVYDGSFFSVSGAMSTPSDFDGGTLSNDVSATTFPLTPNGSFLGYQTPLYPTQAAMDADLPQADYDFEATNSVTLDSEDVYYTYDQDAYPLSDPQLDAASFNDLQNLNPAQTLDLNFNSFIQSTSPVPDENYVFVSIYNPDFSLAFNQGFLSPTTTSATVPGGTLAPNTMYDLSIIFDSRLDGYDDSDSIPVQQAFDNRLDIDFTTTAVPEPASLGLLGIGAMALLARRRAKT